MTTRFLLFSNSHFFIIIIVVVYYSYYLTSCSFRLQNVINMPYKEGVEKKERDTDNKNKEKLIVWGLNQDNWAL